MSFDHLLTIGGAMAPIVALLLELHRRNTTRLIETAKSGEEIKATLRVLMKRQRRHDRRQDKMARRLDTLESGRI